MRRFLVTGSSIFLIWLILAPVVSGGVIYVNDDAPGPIHNGKTWDKAFTSLQDALDAAQTDDNIWVAKGTYKPEKLFDPNEPRSACFSLINHVSVYGGFAGTENPASFDLDDRDFELNETILTGDLNGNGRDPNDSYHVFYHPEGTNLDPNAILDGFTITGGNADVYNPYSGTPHDDGAGIYNYQSSPTIKNCTFINNSSDLYGGGIYNEYGQPIIDNCFFYDNHAGAGGGIKNLFSNAIITNCIFSENSAIGGGAIAASSETSYIANCRFENNRAYGGWWDDISVGPAPGGGAIRTWGSDCKIADCVFIANKVQCGYKYFGGAIAALSGGNPTLINCLFVGNKARGDDRSYGGGMFNAGANPTLINCVFTGNSAILTAHR
jgi:predicted outer membrane repeat protein